MLIRFSRLFPQAYHVRLVPCQDGVARPQVADGEDGLQIWRAAVDNRPRPRALENVHAEVNIYRTWETITENIKISAKECLGYYELKKHTPWLDEACSKLLDRRKQPNLVVTESKRSKWV
jgi:hypothetical protein